MIVQCATFSESLNPGNINESVSDIRIRIRFPFQSRFWISVSGCKLTILPGIQPANRIAIISGMYYLVQCSGSQSFFTFLHYNPNTVNSSPTKITND